MGYWHETLMRDECVCIHVSVLVCTDLFVFVMEKCLYFPCLCWSTVSSQKHGLPLKQLHHIAFFFFFFSRWTFKIGCQDSFPQPLAKRSRNSLHCSGSCQWIGLSEHGLFKLFFSPCVEETDAETWDPESQGQQMWPIVKVTVTSWSMWSSENEDDERSLSWDI